MYMASMNSGNDTMRICFLNKNPFRVRVSVSYNQAGNMNLQDINVYTLKDSGNGSDFQALKPLLQKNSDLQFLSPEVSLTMITLVK